MRLRWRKRNTPPAQDSGEVEAVDAERSLRQAEDALSKVRDQREHGFLIARTLAEIRKEDHFREIWNKGMNS